MIYVLWYGLFVALFGATITHSFLDNSAAVRTFFILCIVWWLIDVLRIALSLNQEESCIYER